MIMGSVMALIAVVLLCVGVDTIRTGRVPGPSWLRSMWWHKVSSWQAGIGFVALGVSTSMWAVSMFTGNPWASVLAWLVAGAWVLFRVIMREREASRDGSNRRVWYRMPSALDGADAVANGSGGELKAKGDTENQV